MRKGGREERGSERARDGGGGRPTLEYASAVCDLYTQHKMSH